jgi:hypothetical protein
MATKTKTAAKTAAKAPVKGDVIHEHGWHFHIGTDSVEGKKQHEPGGPIAEVTGRTLDEARASAAARDQQIRQQTAGQAIQAAQYADELRAKANTLEGK